MSVMDKLKGMVGKNEEKADQAVDKATSYADDKTGGKHSDQIDKGGQKAHDYIEGQSDQGQDEQGQGGKQQGGKQGGDSDGENQ